MDVGAELNCVKCKSCAVTDDVNKAKFNTMIVVNRAFIDRELMYRFIASFTAVNPKRLHKNQFILEIKVTVPAFSNIVPSLRFAIALYA